MTKEIKRTPIVLNRNAIALIKVFTRYSNLGDLWAQSPEIDKFIQEQIEESNKAAKQFIAQLEGHWTPRFLKALRKEIDRVLKEFDKEIKELEEK